MSLWPVISMEWEMPWLRIMRSPLRMTMRSPSMTCAREPLWM